MADTLTATPEEVTVSFPILKTDTTPDGDLLVYGRVTDGTVDSDNQIVNSEWSGKALRTWLETGANLRVQHQAMRDPAGVGLEVELNRDGDGGHWLKALVAEPVAKRLVSIKALRAFSVGIMRPKVVRHSKARGGEIIDGELGEVSLVDRPANRNCAFALVKSDKSGDARWVGEMEGDAEVITKMLDVSVPSPAVIAKMLNGRNHEPEVMPAPEQGTIPGGPFADPVARRLNEAIAAEKRDFSASQRRDAADSGDAMPDGSFPIKNGEDLGNAIHLAGHGKNPGAARAHIKRRAAALGMSDRIPDSWKTGEDVDIAKGSMPCKPCNGTGKDDGKTCSCCGGSGMMSGKAEGEAGEAKAGGKCPTCAGKGTIRGGSMNCPDCGGKKKPDTDKTMPPAKKASGASDEQDDDSHSSGPADDDADEDELGNKAAKVKPDAGTSASRPKRPSAGRDTVAAGAHATDPSDDDDDAGSDRYAGNKGKKNKGLCCSECGCAAGKKAAFCSGCGAEFIGKGVRGTGDPGTTAGNNQPTGRLPRHREPDGSAVEIFEEASGLTDGDEAEEGTSEPTPTWGKGMKTGDPAAGVKAKPGTKRTPPAPKDDRGDGDFERMSKPKKGRAIMGASGTEPVGQGGTSKSEAPYVLARAHDAFCAAWDAGTVLSEYPSLKSVADAVSLEEIQQAAVKAIGQGDYQLGAALAAVAAAGESIKEAGAEEIADARASLHKAFTDMYPTAHPTPGSISAQQFQRPYISSGHASMSAEPMGAQPPGRIPPPAKPASSFRRGPLTSGHESPSPGNKALDMITFHDYIASAYPELCPMSAVPVSPSELEKAEIDGAAMLEDLAAKVRENAITIEQAQAQIGMAWTHKDDTVKTARPAAQKVSRRKATGGLRLDDRQLAKVVQESILKAVGALPTRDEIGNLISPYETRVRAQEEQIEKLQALVDKLGAMPDPAQAPNRGISVSSSWQASDNGGGAAIVERRSLVDEAAAQERDERLKYAKSLAQSGDPVQRELAQTQITKLLQAP